MNSRQLKLSKFMSYALRHNPGEFGLELDSLGFCKTEDLLSTIQKQKGFGDTTLSDIEEAVRICPKQRFAIEGEHIRANYGHSAKRLEYEEKEPPAILYHGTHEGVYKTIIKEGIKKMGREFVHLSEGTGFAKLAGSRRGNPVIMMVNAKKAYEDGIKFYTTGDDVWLCDYIPPEYSGYTIGVDFNNGV